MACKIYTVYIYMYKTCLLVKGEHSVHTHWHTRAHTEKSSNQHHHDGSLLWQVKERRKNECIALGGVSRRDSYLLSLTRTLWFETLQNKAGHHQRFQQRCYLECFHGDFFFFACSVMEVSSVPYTSSRLGVTRTYLETLKQSVRESLELPTRTERSCFCSVQLGGYMCVCLFIKQSQ